MDPYPYWPGKGRDIAIQSEVEDFFNSPEMLAPQDSVIIYAVGGFGSSHGDRGLALINSLMSTSDIASGYDNRALLGRGTNAYTAPHELLHHLLDSHHDQWPGEHQYIRMLWHRTRSGFGIGDTKRISLQQEAAIFGNGETDPASRFITTP